MKLPIHQLHEGDNILSLDSLRDGWVREMVSRIEARGHSVLGAFRGMLRLVKLEPNYYLKGRLDFKVQQSCARCAEVFDMPMSHDFEVAFAHVDQAKVDSLHSEESEELDINFFEGVEIDLAPVLEEQFFLSLPFQAICREECKGICQKCGRNLNVSACRCEHASTVSPFSALERLKF